MIALVDAALAERMTVPLTPPREIVPAALVRLNATVVLSAVSRNIERAV